MFERYKPKDLIKKTKEVSFSQFKPEANGRDRFGNRFFPAKDFSYLDREERMNQAGILVSQEGENFISSNPGILRDISQGLAKLEPRGDGVVLNKKVDVGDGRTLGRIKSGHQSNVFLLTIGEKKYVVKTHIPKKLHQYQKDFYQPYVNEMLQVQSVATDLGRQLRMHNIAMPTFLFASGQVSCSVFEQREEKRTLSYRELEQRVREFTQTLRLYVSGQKAKKVSLWNNIEIDGMSRHSRLDGSHENFITREDGVIVWIDPFIYDNEDYDW